MGAFYARLNSGSVSRCKQHPQAEDSQKLLFCPPEPDHPCRTWSGCRQVPAANCITTNRTVMNNCLTGEGHRARQRSNGKRFPPRRTHARLRGYTESCWRRKTTNLSCRRDRLPPATADLSTKGSDASSWAIPERKTSILAPLYRRSGRGDQTSLEFESDRFATASCSSARLGTTAPLRSG